MRVNWRISRPLPGAKLTTIGAPTRETGMWLMSRNATPVG